MVIDATHVAIDSDDPAFVLVGFESEGGGSLRYLMLQRSRTFDGQDVAPGMDAVHIERDDQGYSAYGGITHFELRRDRALIRLDAVTTGKLGGEAEFEVRFGLEDGQFEGLRAGLADIFRGFDCFVDRAT